MRGHRGSADRAGADPGRKRRRAGDFAAPRQRLFGARLRCPADILLPSHRLVRRGSQGSVLRARAAERLDLFPEISVSSVRPAQRRQARCRRDLSALWQRDRRADRAPGRRKAGDRQSGLRRRHDEQIDPSRRRSAGALGALQPDRGELHLHRGHVQGLSRGLSRSHVAHRSRLPG